MAKGKPPSSRESSERLRFYVALILVIAYVLLLLLLPWAPEVRDPLLFLGPLVGVIVDNAFSRHQGAQ